MRSVRATLRGRAKIFKRAREVVFSLRTQLVSRRKDGGGGSSRAAVGDGRTDGGGKAGKKLHKPCRTNEPKCGGTDFAGNKNENSDLEAVSQLSSGLKFRPFSLVSGKSHEEERSPALLREKIPTR